MKTYTVLARDITTKAIRKVGELKCKTEREARQAAMITYWGGLDGNEAMIVASPEQMKRQWSAAL